MKKNVYFVLLSSSLFFFLLIASVSALTPRDVGEQVKDFYIGFFEPILGALFGGWDLGGLFLFEKFLIFVMLVATIFVIIKKVDIFKDNKVVIWIIAIVIPLIAVRFFNIEQISTIIFSYKWLAIALTTILPLIIFFFFVYNLGGDHPILRRMLWIILLGVFIGMYSSASGEIDSNVYVWTIVAIIAFIILDRRINNYFNLAKLKKADKYWKYTAVAKIDEDIRLIMASSLPVSEKEKLRKEKEKLKKDLLKDSY